MEKEFLSKQKHIFEIYTTMHGIAVEKMPVIYINQKYVYYKRSGSYALESRELDRVHEFDDKKAREYLYRMINGAISLRDGHIVRARAGFKMYFWTFEFDPKELLKISEEYANTQRVNETVKLLENAKEKLRLAKEEYERAQIQLAELQLKEKENDRSRTN